LAGFQVTIIGRFWVTAEAQLPDEVAEAYYFKQQYIPRPYNVCHLKQRAKKHLKLPY